jgi:hypothetical protein
LEDCRRGRLRVLNRALLEWIVRITRLRWLLIWEQVVFGVGVVETPPFLLVNW